MQANAVEHTEQLQTQQFADSSVRWFDATHQQLLQELAKTLDKTPAQGIEKVRSEIQTEQKVFTAFMGILGILGTGLVGLVMSLDFKDKPASLTTTQDFVTLAACGLGVAVLLAAGTWIVCGLFSAKRIQRAESFDTLMQRYGIKSLGRVSLDKELFGGRIPWFFSHVEEIRHLIALGIGRFEDLDVAFVEGLQRVNPLNQLNNANQFTIMSNLPTRQRNLAYNQLDAMVWLEPLRHVPDMLVMHKKDPNGGYFARVLGVECFMKSDFVPYGGGDKFRVASPIQTGRCHTSPTN